MQETNYSGIKYQEIFCGDDDDDIKQQMDRRLKILEDYGHELVRRVKIKRIKKSKRQKKMNIFCGRGK